MSDGFKLISLLLSSIFAPFLNKMTKIYFLWFCIDNMTDSYTKIYLYF